MKRRHRSGIPHVDLRTVVHTELLDRCDVWEMGYRVEDCGTDPSLWTSVSGRRKAVDVVRRD